MKLKLNNTTLVLGEFTMPSGYSQSVSVVAGTDSGNNNKFYSTILSGMTKIRFYLVDNSNCVSNYYILSTNGKSIKLDTILVPNKLYTFTTAELNPAFLSASLFGCYVKADGAAGTGTVTLNFDVVVQ